MLLFCVLVPPIFQRVNNREAAWGFGDEEYEISDGMVEKREVVLGHTITLSCESNAIPPPKLSWYKDGQKLTTADGVLLLPGIICTVMQLCQGPYVSLCFNKFVFLGGEVLQIGGAQKEDAGKYTCEAVNEAGQDQMHFELEVLGKKVHSL